MTPIKEAYKCTANTVIKELEKNNMKGYYCENSEEAVKLALSLMPAGSKISWGGSASIKDCGLLDAVRKADYEIFDRDTATTPEEKKQLYSQVMLCDYFLMSSNAVTLNGELVNIDGTGNRLAPMICGPDNVIMIVGMNKLARDIEAAYDRIKVNACPPNAIRLNLDTPCAKTGKCFNCTSPSCICCQIVVTRFSRIKDRIKVILVGEELGF